MVTSIHQPNNDLLMLFDSLYVLAKGGICIYNGTPGRLYDHLEEAGILCKEYQSPVEIVMKLASVRNSEIELLLDHNMTNKIRLEQRCATEAKLSRNGVSHESIQISRRHFLILLFRATISLFVSQWKSMIVQFLFSIWNCLLLFMVFDKHMGQPDGCFTKGQSDNRTDINEELHIESQLIQNLTFLIFSDVIINFVINLEFIVSFAAESRIFFNEHKNGLFRFYFSLPNLKPVV